MVGWFSCLCWFFRLQVHLATLRQPWPAHFAWFSPESVVFTISISGMVDHWLQPSFFRIIQIGNNMILELPRVFFVCKRHFFHFFLDLVGAICCPWRFLRLVLSFFPSFSDVGASFYRHCCFLATLCHLTFSTGRGRNLHISVMIFSRLMAVFSICGPMWM